MMEREQNVKNKFKTTGLGAGAWQMNVLLPFFTAEL